MHHNKDPAGSDFLFEDWPQRFKSMEPDKEFLDLVAELRARDKLHDPDVQWLIEKAALCSDPNARWARNMIKLLIESDRIQGNATGDVYRPLAPSQLLSQGDLYLIDQVDGTAWKVPMNALTRGMLVTGAQGGGKSMFLIFICKQSMPPAFPFLYWIRN